MQSASSLVHVRVQAAAAANAPAAPYTDPTQPTTDVGCCTTAAVLRVLAYRSASQLAVVALHIHAAPPCVRSYARMHGVAQQYSGAAAPARVSFGVMDVDVAPEGAALSSKLGVGVGQFPTYVIFKDGQEVARLSSSPDRRKLGEVLAQQVAEATAAGNECSKP